MLGGCGNWFDDGPDVGGPEQQPPNDETVVVGAELECTAETTTTVQAEVDGLVSDFRAGLVEMVGCGTLNADLSRGVSEGIVYAIIEGRNDATPADWSYEGEGTYYTTGARADMETRFYLTEDFEFGKRGDLVEANVFDVDSYLVGARVTASAEDLLRGVSQLHFDDTGPLVELLGFGPNPSSPIEVDALDVLSLGNKLRALEFESDVEVANLDDSSVVFRLQTQRMPARSLLLGERMRYELDSFRAVRGDLEIEIDDWDAGFFADGSLDGGVSFRVVTQTEITCELELIFAEIPRWPEWKGD